MDTWSEQYFLEPLRSLLAAMSVGEATRDGLSDGASWGSEPLRLLSIGVEGRLRTELQRYAGWPPESTTDGSDIEIVRRSSENTIEIWGMAWIDFAGEMFPFRAELEERGSGAELRMWIGDVDANTGQPPRLKRGALLVPVTDNDGQRTGVELIDGRQQRAVEWTAAFQVDV